MNLHQYLIADMVVEDDDNCKCPICGLPMEYRMQSVWADYGDAPWALWECDNCGHYHSDDYGHCHTCNCDLGYGECIECLREQGRITNDQRA